MADQPTAHAIVAALTEVRRAGYYTGACDSILSRAREIDALHDGTTHADGCWAWGPKHHECAMREIDRLRAERDALRERIARAPAATVSMVGENEVSGCDDATSIGTYMHGAGDSMHSPIGQRVRLVVEDET